MADTKTHGSLDPGLEPAADDLLKLPPFQYPPLPTPTSIRLVEILPSGSDVLRCRMTGLDLDDRAQTPPPYVALSYTWGDPITTKEEPAPAPEEIKLPEDFPKLPFVFKSSWPGGVEIYNTDYAMKYYVERHPWIPRVKGSALQIAQQPIEIDGHLVYLQENLYCFLKEYRSFKFSSSLRSAAAEDDEHEDSSLRKALDAPIWIDALCINQDNQKERTSQVQLMSRIFRQAKRVFAWLGPPDRLTNDAMEGLDKIYESDILATSGKRKTLSSFEGMDLIHWFAVFSFFQRSWFRRAWVTQEAIFGRESITVVHGGVMFSWEWLSMVAAALKKSGLNLEMLKLGRNLLNGEPLSDNTRQLRKLAAFVDDDNDGDDDGKNAERNRTLTKGMDGVSFATSIRDFIYRFRTEGDNIFTQYPPLLRVLSLFRDTDATDPRDKVFAFLNLAFDKEALALIPDYSVDVKTVFRQTVEAILRTTKSLSFLSQVQEPCDTKIPQLPGWVPDFSTRLPFTPLDTGDDDVLFCASGPGTKAWFDIRSDDTMEVESIELDAVATSEWVEQDTEDTVLNVLKTILRIPLQYPIGEFEQQDEVSFDDTDSDLVRALGKEYEEAEKDCSDRDSVSNGAGTGTHESYGNENESLVDKVEQHSEQISGRESGEEEGKVTDTSHASSSEEHGSTRKDDSPHGTGSGDEDEEPDEHALCNSTSLSAAEIDSDDRDLDDNHHTPNEAYPSTDTRDDSHKNYTIRAITRIEAVWRTLVGNTLPKPTAGFFLSPDQAVTYPAPTALGHGFSNWVEANLLEMWHLAQYFDSQMPTQGGAAARRLLTTLAVWAAVYKGKHIPLTRDTVGYTLESNNLVELAKAEEKEENEMGFTFSGQRFFPRALRLNRLMDGAAPPEEFRGYEGDPQASVDGQWRERALMQFTEDERAGIDAFEKRMRTMLEGRRMFTTMGGLVGLGPKSVFSERGCVYEVHIIKGAKVPYVLARYDDGTHRLIGEAYVHGIMNGEIVTKMGHAEWCKYTRIRLR
ncbi:hypothetical protein EsH8_II_001383 [Colletotrichum jinshuiense]